MAEDQLRTLIDGIRSRLQAELEAHLGSVTETHEHAIANARQQVEADAEQRWLSKLDEALQTPLELTESQIRERGEKAIDDALADPSGVVVSCIPGCLALYIQEFPPGDTFILSYKP